MEKFAQAMENVKVQALERATVPVLVILVLQVKPVISVLTIIFYRIKMKKKLFVLHVTILAMEIALDLVPRLYILGQKENDVEVTLHFKEKNLSI